MTIEENLQKADLLLRNHEGTHAPYPVQARVLALCSDDLVGEVRAGHTEYRREGDGRTWWVVWLLADALIHVEIHRPGRPYWEAEDSDFHKPNEEHNDDDVRQAWLRPLTSVTSVELVDFRALAPLAHEDGRRWRSGLRLNFRDGSFLDLPEKRSTVWGGFGFSDVADGVREHMLNRGDG